MLAKNSGDKTKIICHTHSVIMSRLTISKALAHYSPLTVFVPFTLVFFSVIGIQIFSIFTQHPILTRDPYGVVLLIATVFIILSSYFLTYSMLVQSLFVKKPALIIVSLAGFVVMLWYSLSALVALTQNNFIFSILQPLTVAVFTLFIQVLVSNTRYLLQAAGMMLLFLLFFTLSLQQFYIATSVPFYPLLNDIFNDIRYWNLGSFAAFIFSFLFFITTVSHFLSALRDAEKLS